MEVLKQVAAVGFGGGLGALCRHGVTVGAIRLFGLSFPLGTVVANLLGCFFIGYLGARVDMLSHPMRLFLMTGVLGGFTTFSTFSLEALQMIHQAKSLMLAVYVGIQLVGGIALAALGYFLGLQASTNR